jgi:hypothetical protein
MKISSGLRKMLRIGLTFILFNERTYVTYATTSDPPIDRNIDVANLSLNEVNTPSINRSSLIPTQDYELHFTVKDDNLDNMLFEVVFVQGEYNPETITGTNKDGSQFGFKWDTRFQDEPMIVYEDFTNSSDSSWSLISSNVLDFKSGLKSFEFVIEFTVSKVAQAADDWGITINVMDDYRDKNSSPTMDSDSLNNISVAWYGEIQLSSENLSWGSIAHDTSYSSLSSLATSSIKIISNGSYDLSAKSSESWLGSSVSDHQTQDLQATLVSDSSLDINSNQTFSLRLNDENSYGLSSAIQLSSEFAWFSLDGLKTNEAGSDVQLYVYVQLSQKFQNGLYWGSVTLGISN